MKSLETVCLLFAMAGLAAAQQYTISTIAGVPEVPGLYPTYNNPVAVPGQTLPPPTPVPAIGPTDGGQLYQPSAIVVDSAGNFYIANAYTYVVNMVTAGTGYITIITGTGSRGSSGDNAAANLATITNVGGIAVDKNGNVYISDTGTCRIRRIDNPITTAVPYITTIAGNLSSNTSPFCGANSGTPFIDPGALAFDSAGNLYVADPGAYVVYKITNSGTGTMSTFAGTGAYGYSGDGGAASKAMLAAPVSLSFDAAGNLYIGDEGNSNIRRIDTSGNITTVATGISPKGMAVDPTGTFFYVVDGVTSVVRKVLPGGAVVTIAGNGQPGYSGDGAFNGTNYTGGPSSLAQVDQPAGLTLGPDGSIYLADSGNDIIRHLVLVPSSLGFQDAASEVPGSNLQAGSISPGEVLLLFGSALGPSTLTQFTLTNGAFPTQIAGTSVTFNGTPAPLIYTSSGLVAVIAPYEIASSATASCVFPNTAPAAVPCANIVLTYQPAGTSASAQFTLSVPIAATTPALFTANETGIGQAAALNANLSVNSAANPAHLGSDIVLYATGAGYTTSPVDGQPAPTTCGIACLPVPQGTVTVKIGNQTVIPAYAGGAPSLVAGVMQVNAQIPATLIPGSVLVQVLVNGYPSQPGVTIAVTQ
jgi:uncharacterized protein (TIGR03437 family)